MHVNDHAHLLARVRAKREGMIAAIRCAMAKLRLAAVLIAMTACAHREATVDTMFPEPIEVNGPPGGDIEASWQSDGSSTTYGAVASADQVASDNSTASVTDLEIDQTLDGYGEWIWSDDYGWVWRPYATEVGLDFTPYETCGSWVWTNDNGWVYGCDWEWGWLPFHYGQWGWFDDYWAWVPDYDWSPAWVDWRGGGGYVGWAPKLPKRRDHRYHLHNPESTWTAEGGVVVTGPLKQRDSHWRFATVEDFGKRNIRAHLAKHAAEGLRVTTVMKRPPILGNVQPVSVAAVMGNRKVTAQRARAAVIYDSPPPLRVRPTAAPAPIREAPTAVEVPMENPPSIWAPGDPMREPTQSPIRSSTSRPIDNTVIEPPQRYTPPAPQTWNPPPAQQQPARVPPAPVNTWSPSAPPAQTWNPPPAQPQPARVPPSPVNTWTPPSQPSPTWSGSSTHSSAPPVHHEPSRASDTRRR